MPIPAGPAPLAVLPGWAPALERVAAYVQRRTLIEADDGYGNIVRTFTDATHPPADVVDRLIGDAVRWVSDRTGDLATALFDSGTGLAARWAAAYVILNYPDTSEDVQIAQILLRQLEIELKALAIRNEALTGVDPADPDGTDGVFEVAGPYAETCGWW